MPLTDTLDTAFAEDGFDLTAAVDALGAVLTAVAPVGAALDPSRVTQIGELLGRADLSPVGGAVEGAAVQTRGLTAGLPDPGQLLGPLDAAVGLVERLGGGDALRAVEALEAGAAAGEGVGMGAVAARLSAVAEIGAGEAVQGATGLLRLVPGLDLAAPVEALREQAPAVAGLVRLVGALMTIEAVTGEVARTAELVGGMLEPAAADAAVTRVLSWRGADLTGTVAGIDPNDAAAVAAALAPMTDFADSIRTAREVLVRGMAFGEATLAQADMPRRARRLDAASAQLDETAVAPVRSLALDLRSRLAPLLDAAVPEQAESLEAFWARATSLLDDLAATIDALDPASLAAPVTSAVAAATEPLRRIREIADETVAAVHSAFATVRQIVAAVDLRPVAEAVRTALQPLVDALDSLDTLLGEAEDAIRDAALGVTGAMNTVRTTLGTGSAAIRAAFERVAAIVDDLDLEQLQRDLEQGVQEVADALARAQLRPYFDTAVEVMETAGDIVAAIPFELLPDDARSELDEVTRPIKAIDFEADVSDVLIAELRAILRTLDTEVLDEVDRAYRQVLLFLEQINPRPALEQLERESFDPMLERVRAVDPTEVLEPVTSVLDRLREAVAEVDLRRDVLEPLDAAFNEVAAVLAELDPGALVRPLEERIDAARESVEEALRLDTWADRIGEVDAFVARVLGKIDFPKLVELLDAVFDEVRPRAGDGSSTLALGTLVSGLLEGTGITARADAFEAARRWIGGGDPAAEIRARLADAAARLQRALEVVSSVDPQELVAAAAPVHRSLVAAVQAHPEDSLLRLTADRVLAGADPLALLGTAVDNRVRYLSVLEEAAATVTTLAGSGRSELTAVSTGLREALRPLTAVPDQVRAVFASFGVDVEGKSIGQIVEETIEFLRPSRSLAPLDTVVARLKEKIAALVHDGLVAPAQATVGDLQALLGALDITFVRTEIEAIYSDLVDEIEAMRPSALLGELVTSAEGALQDVQEFDPFGPVRDVIEEMKAAIEDVANAFRPTLLFAPVLDAYDEILAAAGGLDVRTLLQPVLEALADIELQLEEGLDEAAAALTRLQGVLP
jgi:hypothetical protein